MTPFEDYFIKAWIATTKAKGRSRGPLLLKMLSENDKNLIDDLDGMKDAGRPSTCTEMPERTNVAPNRRNSQRKAALNLGAERPRASAYMESDFCHPVSVENLFVFENMFCNLVAISTLNLLTWTMPLVPPSILDAKG